MPDRVIDERERVLITAILKAVKPLNSASPPRSLVFGCSSDFLLCLNHSVARVIKNKSYYHLVDCVLRFPLTKF